VSNPDAVARGEVMFHPVGFTLDGFTAVLGNAQVVTGFRNSLLYTAVGTTINLIVTLPAAYALSRRDLRGRGVIMAFFLIPMYISGGLIPTFMVVRNLGFLNTMWAVTIPGALSIWNMLIAISFFRQTLPQEMLEAAKLDGATNMKYFLHIALPLSPAIIAILVLWYGVGHWNGFFSALIYITERQLWPLQLVLRAILVQMNIEFQHVYDMEMMERMRQIAQLMRYSLIIVASAPVMIAYPFLQKHFVKGVMIGSIKG